jgi:hypothetical protein
MTKTGKYPFLSLVILQLLVLLVHWPPQACLVTSLNCDCDIHSIDVPSKPIISDLPGRRCALNLYGLPRSFKDLVLPTLIKNVIIPNIHYDCDYFVHFYNVTYEPPSRSGKGGPIMPEDIYLLREAVHKIASRAGRRRPHVAFALDTNERFERTHDTLLQKIRKPGRNPFHWRNFPIATHVNIIKMWYSIAAVWDFMKEHASVQNIHYGRVAVMRSDVVFLTPIDIFKAAPDGIFDTFNNHSVIPGFAQYPVNDRLFYGPYEATEIWAKGRFSRLDDFVYNMSHPLHSERFLDVKILPAIRARSIAVISDPGICFWRARADQSMWVDCGGVQSKGLLATILNRSCTVLPAHLSKNAERSRVLTCNSSLVPRPRRAG